MKTFLLSLAVLLLCFFTGSSSAQNIRLYASPQGAMVLDPSSPKDSLLNPWCGGWLNPQFSSIDLNGDGRLDLFVFMPGFGDFSGNQMLTFLNIGNGQYQYYPEYESYFPSLQNWAILADYNKDGKPDIFTFSQGGGGIDVYKNISGVPGTGLKFKKVTGAFLAYTDDGKNQVNIYAEPNGIPAISDVDGDGDIDIVSFDVTFQRAYYFKNQAAEKGESLDSLDFTNPSQCWGSIAINQNSLATQVNNTLLLHVGCGTTAIANDDGASAMLLVDMDNDGDKDMLYGNIYSKFIVQLTNGRINDNMVRSKSDTILSADSAIIGDVTKVNMNLYPAAYLADGTGDNLEDLIVAPMDYLYDTINHKTWLYKNTGGATGNHFAFETNNFLQNTMVDEGEHAAPAFVDYNGDGLMDLVVATRANPDSGYIYNKKAYDHLVLYENIGSKEKAVYKKVDDDFGALKKYRLAFLAPTFADLDGDGRPDMFLGTKSGKVMYFKNEADSGNTLIMKLVSDSMPDVYTSGISTPCLAHISNDSLFDLVMGCDSGTIFYYKNTGSKIKPVFTQITSYFGKIRTNDSYWNYTKYRGITPIDSELVYYGSGGTAPMIADLDHNGKPDLVTGSTQGEMFFYFNITDNLNDSFVRTDTVFYNTLLQKKENKKLGTYTMPAAADLNNDGYPELLVGNYLGGILYYGSKTVKLGIDNSPGPVANASFKIYPNPAKNDVNISYYNPTGPQPVKIEITGLLGQTVSAYSFMMQPGPGKQQITTAPLAPGIYIVNIATASEYLSGQKLIINR